MKIGDAGYLVQQGRKGEATITRIEIVVIRETVVVGIFDDLGDGTGCSVMTCLKASVYTAKPAAMRALWRLIP